MNLVERLFSSILLNKNKLAAIGFSAYPGASRLLLFVVVGYLSTTDAYASFASIYFQAMLYSAIIGAGYGTLVLKAESITSIKVFLLIIPKGVFSILPLTLALCFYTSDIHAWFAAFLYGVTFSLLVVFRFEVIKQKLYLIGVVFETIVLVMNCIVIYFYKNDLILATHVLSMFNLLFVILVKLNIKGEQLSSNIKLSTKIGYSSLCSSGVVFIVPLIINQVGDVKLSSVIADVTILMGVITLIPRSHTNYVIPDLINLFRVNDKKAVDKLVSISFVNLTASILGVLILLSCIYIKWGLLDINVITFVLLICVYQSIGQTFMADSILVNVNGLENLSLVVNFFILIGLIATGFIMINSYFNSSMFIVPCYLIFANIARSLLFRRKILEFKG